MFRSIAEYAATYMSLQFRGEIQAKGVSFQSTGTQMIFKMLRMQVTTNIVNLDRADEWLQD